MQEILSCFRDIVHQCTYSIVRPIGLHNFFACHSNGRLKISGIQWGQEIDPVSRFDWTLKEKRIIYILLLLYKSTSNLLYYPPFFSYWNKVFLYKRSSPDVFRTREALLLSNFSEIIRNILHPNQVWFINFEYLYRFFLLFFLKNSNKKRIKAIIETFV